MSTISRQFNLNLKKTQSNIVEDKPAVSFNNQSLEKLYNNDPKAGIREKQIIIMEEDHESNQTSYYKRPLEIKQSKGQQNVSETYAYMQKRRKLPASIKQSLRRKAQQSENFKMMKSNQKISQFGLAILSKFKKEQIACGICLGVMNEKDIVYLCKCSHTYCKQCIRNYVTYKIKMYEEVICPEESCNVLMNQETEFYQNLAEDIKKQYVKIHNFYITSNDPTLKLCPKENCQGIIKIIENEPRICGLCKRDFCPKCYFEKHNGECDQMELDFLQNNLHFRQCQNCKMVVERTEGCNHMTCKCKYEFCYVCGKKWTGYDHRCNQNQAQIQAEARAGIFDEGGCFECCDCGAQTCGQICQSIWRFPIRLLISIPVAIFFVLMFINSLGRIMFFLATTIFMGLFGYSVMFICEVCQNESTLSATMLVIFFPIAMVIGVYRGVTEMFFEMAAQECGDYCQIVQNGFRNIWS